MVPSTVRLYSRRACGLCDQARAVILAERDRGAIFRFEEVLVDGDPRLEAAYGVRVPVVEIDGREAFEYSVEPGRFRRLVSR
jgi:glutaredoxin